MEETTPLEGHDRGEGWHLGLRRNRMFIVGAVGVGVLFVLTGGIATAHGSTGAGIVQFVIAVAAFLFPWLRSHRRIAPFEFEGRVGSGLALPLNPISWAATLIFLIIAGLCIAGVVAIAMGKADTDNRVGLIAASLFMCVLGVFFLLGAYGGVMTQLRHNRCLLLTEEGVVFNTERRPTTMPWGAVRAVRPHWTSMRQGWFRFDDLVQNWLSVDADPARISGRTRMSAMARTKQPTVDAEALAMDPWLALAVLRFYAEHDDQRAELRSAVALDRVASIARDLSQDLTQQEQ